MLSTGQIRSVIITSECCRATLIEVLSCLVLPASAAVIIFKSQFVGHMNHREGADPSFLRFLWNIRGIINAFAPLRYCDCVSIFTSAPENLTGGYFYSAMWLVIYLKQAVIGNHFHVFGQFLSSSKWQVILPAGEIGLIFYWEARQFFNNARSLIMLREVNGHLQKMTKASKDGSLLRSTKCLTS